jgi:REP element-mobilizing transposase RayT
MTKLVGAQKKKSLRLEGYDYSKEGAYFITITSVDHKCLFGNVIEGKNGLSNYGRIVHDEWLKSSKVRSEIELFEDEFVVMPNHIHGIVWVIPGRRQENVIKKSSPPLVRATGRLPIHNAGRYEPGPSSKSLSAFVAGYKSAVTKKINIIRGTPGKSVWMRNYHDRVIRNERELKAIRVYINGNPLKWELDRYYSMSNS